MTPVRPPRPYPRTGATGQAGLDLDRIDRELLNLLQHDCRMPVSQLAARLGLSLSSCHRRLRRLRASRLISREVAMVDPRWSPRALTVIVEVVLAQRNAERQQAFKAAMGAAPEVSQCYAIAGAVDYIVVLQLSDMAEYETVSNRLFTQDANVARSASFVATSRIKFETAVRF